MKRLVIALLGMTMAGAAFAKLPAPSPEAQAKAEEAKQKTAWADKVAAYQLCQAQDRVAASYRKAKGGQPTAEAAPAAAGTVPVPALASTGPSTAVAGAAPTIPPCQDPGPYVAAAASAKVGVADAQPVPAAGKPPSASEANK